MDIEDHSALVDWLRASGRIESDENPMIQTLAGGVSNRTVLVQRTGSHQDAWVVKQGLEKLRVKADWFCDPARVHREAAGLRVLQSLLPVGSVPGYVGEDDAHHLLLMDAVPHPHDNWKTLLLAGQLDLDHCDQFGTMLGMIHRRSAERRDDIGAEFDDRKFFEALRLEPYYSYASEQVPKAAAFMNDLLERTRSRRLTLVHGDYSPKNVLVHRGKLVLLDHEVIHWGDPAFDVGFGLTHLLSKAHHLTDHRNEFQHAAHTVWQSYSREIAASGWRAGLEPEAVRHTLGCLLARVAGRSPLEYLTDREQMVQQRAVLELMKNPANTVDELIDWFVESL